jgi:hypothetical protein
MATVYGVRRMQGWKGEEVLVLTFVESSMGGRSALSTLPFPVLRPGSAYNSSDSIRRRQRMGSCEESDSRVLGARSR